MIILILFIFLCNWTSATTYHKTEEIFNIFETLPDVNISYYKDIMVVDVNTHLPRDVLIVANEHARERITAEVALYFLKSIKKTLKGA